MRPLQRSANADEPLFLHSGDVRVAGVAQHVQMETVTEPGLLEAGQHRLEVANHPLRQFVADAEQNRCRCRDRLIAANYAPPAGITAAIGSGEKRKIRNPIMAFQNPATIHGNVIANSTISTMSIALKPAGDSANAASAIDPAMETREQSSKQYAPAGDGVSGGIDLCGLKYGERSNTRLRLLIPEGPCELDDITQQMFQ